LTAWTVHATPVPGSSGTPPGIGTPLTLSTTITPFLRDPYQSNQAELDVVFQVPCFALSGQTGVQIQVVVPASSGLNDNIQGDFSGGFGPIYLPGDVGGVATPGFNGAYISFDGANTFTFFGFDYFQSVGNGYVEVVVDILDSTFAQYAPNFLLNPLIGQTTASITLNNYADFFPTTTDTSCAQAGGDPQFAGFQGQNFQFHGMADEVFNLISTPTFQMNGNFKYLSSGKCDYNETVCYTHPGTYVDQLGFVIGDVQVKAISGAHESGLRLWMNDVEVKHAQTAIQNKVIFSYWNSSEFTGSVQFTQKGKFTIDLPQFTVEVTNSDYFFNLEVSLKDSGILRSGAKSTKLHKKFLCSSTGMKSSERLAIVEDEMSKHYPRVPIHGLIGQTWRNAVICDHAWVGDASDYVTSSLFAYDSAFNYYGTAQ